MPATPSTEGSTLVLVVAPSCSMAPFHGRHCLYELLLKSTRVLVVAPSLSMAASHGRQRLHQPVLIYRFCHGTDGSGSTPIPSKLASKLWMQPKFLVACLQYRGCGSGLTPVLLQKRFVLQSGVEFYMRMYVKIFPRRAG